MVRIAARSNQSPLFSPPWAGKPDTGRRVTTACVPRYAVAKTIPAVIDASAKEPLAFTADRESRRSRSSTTIRFSMSTSLPAAQQTSPPPCRPATTLETTAQLHPYRMAAGLQSVCPHRRMISHTEVLGVSSAMITICRTWCLLRKIWNRRKAQRILQELCWRSMIPCQRV